MARVKGIVKIEGTLDELTFYRTKDGDLVKTKGGISKERIANDPQFARTRENGNEFALAAKASKLLNDIIKPLTERARDYRVTSRMVKVMTQIKNLDTISVRGKREVQFGIATVTGKNYLRGFGFNKDAPLNGVMAKEFVLNTATGEIKIQGLNPLSDIKWAAGASHAVFQGGWAKVDFANSKGDLELTNEETALQSNAGIDVKLNVVNPPTGNGVNFYFLGISFYQEVNGLKYPLNNGQYNVLQIIEVS